jgi:hypothetical protein
MATSYWLGTADAVAQAASGSIDTVDGTPGNNTFTVTIGGHAVSTAGDTDVATTAAALVTALNNSTDPYFAAVTWANPSAGNITATADTAGVPFVAALTVSGGGTGTVTDFSDTTASAGPNHWDTAANWSEGSAPGAGDNVIIADNAVNIMWGLDQNAVTVASIRVDKTYTGKIGHDWKTFATSADGETTDATEVEYRQKYLKIRPTLLTIGEATGVGAPAGSTRLMIDCSNDATDIEIHDTAKTSAETGRTAVRLLTASATADLYVHHAPGGVSLAADVPDETSTIGTVNVYDQSAATRTVVGSGTTITTYTQLGGTNVLRAGVTTLNVRGGVLRTEGVFATTTINQTAGTLVASHSNGGSACCTTCNLDGGIIDFAQSGRARTVTTMNHEGGQIVADPGVLTVTTYNEPQDGPYILQVAQ